MPKIFKPIGTRIGPPPRGKKPAAEPSGRHDAPRILDERSHVGPGGFLSLARAATEDRAVQAGSATESRTTVWQLMTLFGSRTKGAGVEVRS
jgi:hypothetical protein